MRALSLLLIAAIAAPSLAADPIVIQVPSAGTYVLTYDAAGTARLSGPHNLVTPGGVVPVPTPDPTPTPTPDPVPSNAAAVKAEVEKIPANDQRHQSAVKLTALYRFVAAQVRNGTIPQANIQQAVDGYLAIMLIGDNRWGGVTAKIAGFLATCASPSSCADVLEESAGAILATVPEPLQAEQVVIPEAMAAVGADQELASKASAYGINWDTLFALLLQLLPLILKLFTAVTTCLSVLV